MEQPFALGAWKWKEKEEMEANAVIFGNTTPQGPSHKISAPEIPLFLNTATPDKPSGCISWENNQADCSFINNSSAVGT